jgi:hypothetical protein
LEILAVILRCAQDDSQTARSSSLTASLLSKRLSKLMGERIVQMNSFAPAFFAVSTSDYFKSGDVIAFTT